MVEIKKDTSGKTLQYILTLKGKEIMCGDGYETEEEIHEFMDELVEAIKEKAGKPTPPGVVYMDESGHAQG